MKLVIENVVNENPKSFVLATDNQLQKEIDMLKQMIEFKDKQIAFFEKQVDFYEVSCVCGQKKKLPKMKVVYKNQFKFNL